MASGGEIPIDGALDRCEVKLLQAPDLGVRERLLGDVGERRPAPQRKRLARHVARDERLEAQRIDLAVTESQLVPAPARDDLRAVAADREGLAKLRDVELHHLRRRRRGLVAPEGFNEAIARHRRALVQRQNGQQRPRLAPPDGNQAAVGRDLHRTEDADLHGPPVIDLARRYRGSQARTRRGLPALYPGSTPRAEPPRDKALTHRE
jgi:hypothetical protein